MPGVPDFAFKSLPALAAVSVVTRERYVYRCASKAGLIRKVAPRSWRTQELMSNPYEYRGRLASEDVVVQAPMSFTGSAKRVWKITRMESPGARAGMITLAVILIAFAWAAVFTWYCIFGLWLVPYRLVRRGDRSRKRQTLQHREMLAQLEKAQQATMMASLVDGIGTVSPDGHYIWDGTAWRLIAVRAQTPPVEASRISTVAPSE